MFDETKAPTRAKECLKDSLVHGGFHAKADDALQHKWPESGWASEEVAFERALTEWILRHRAKWRSSRELEARLETLSSS